MTDAFNKDRLYAENESLRERIAELEQENKDLDDSLTIAYMQGYSDGKAKLKEHKDNE